MPPLFALFDIFDPFTSLVSQRIIFVGALTNVACALVGCFLVLRRMSLMGDAIAHAVLPGIVLAFLFSGSMSVFPLFLGAAAVGLFTTFLTQTLHQFGRVPPDASMGVVFTSLFALGVVMIKRHLTGVHFDVACVYEGSLSQAALDTIAIGTWEIPRQAIFVGPVAVLNALGISLIWKELKISSFDSALSTAMGYSATLMHYLLMTAVAITTVAAFEAVGSILVIAMLIVPPSTAHLLTDRLLAMIAIACLLAILASVLGYWLAYHWDVAPAGAMTVAAGTMYALAVLFSPRYGVLSKLLQNLQTTLRILREDLLLMLYRVEELDPTRRLRADEAIAALGGGWLTRSALRMLEYRGRIERREGKLEMTDDGRRRAARLVRSHRLWEAYLHKHLDLPLDHVHLSADRLEHFTDQPLRDRLQEAINDAEQDPHGREIPNQE